MEFCVRLSRYWPWPQARVEVSEVKEKSFLDYSSTYFLFGKRIADPQWYDLYVREGQDDE